MNGRSASPWAAAGTAAARVRSSKVYGLRSKGILLAKEGNGDLSEVSGEHHKAWRMCYMRCEHLFTPLTDPIIPVAPGPPSQPRGERGHCAGGGRVCLTTYRGTAKRVQFTHSGGTGPKLPNREVD